MGDGILHRFQGDGILHRFQGDGILHRIQGDGILYRFQGDGILYRFQGDGILYCFQDDNIIFHFYLFLGTLIAITMLVYVIITIISAIFVTIINIYCVTILIRSKKIRSPPHMTICGLLLGHALQGMFVIPCYAAKKSGIYKNTIVCEIFLFSYLLTNYWCCLSVLVITIDRFIGVQFPLKYKIWVTTKRLSRVLFCVWLYVLILCLIPFAPSDSKACKYNPQKQWVITMLIVNTLIPFIIVMILYIFIFKKIKMVLKGKRYSTMNLTESRSKKELKRAKITFFIVATYVVCWGPSVFYYILQTLCPKICFHKHFHDSKTEEVVNFLIKFLTFVDGLIGPLIYCCASRNFNTLRRGVIASFREKVRYNIRNRKVTIDSNDLSMGKVSVPVCSKNIKETIINGIIFAYDIQVPTSNVSSTKVTIENMRRRISCNF